MGIYLNPNNDSFQMMLNTDTYVDKSLLINYTNEIFATEKTLCLYQPSQTFRQIRQSEYAFSLLQQGL